MSISLNDHENRIKKLESQPFTSFSLDFSRTKSLGNVKTYKADSHGLIIVNALSNNSTATGVIKINGYVVDHIRHYNGEWTEGCVNLSYPVSLNDVIDISQAVFSGYRPIEVIFIPAKTLYYKVLEITSSFIKEVLLCLYLFKMLNLELENWRTRLYRLVI